MANLSGCQRSGIAILSGFLHLQAHLESSKTTSIKVEELCQSLAETHSTSASIIHLIMRVHLIGRGIKGVKKQKRKKVKSLLWKTETLQAPVPRPLVEKWEQRDLCCFPSFYLGFQQVPRDQCAYHQCQWWHSSVHTTLGIHRDNRSQWECANWEMLCLGHRQPKGEQLKDYFIWACAANSCCWLASSFSSITRSRVKWVSHQKWTLYMQRHANSWCCQALFSF